MCLAIWKPAGKTVTKEHLTNGYNSNSDGAGIAYAHKGKLFIDKGFFKFDDFYAVYEKVQALPCLIHFRIKTHGNINANNCHPWRVNENLALIHNGILSLKEADGMSDTGVFAKYVLAPLLIGNQNVWKTSGMKWLIEEAIGTGNKIALMDNNGDFSIFNEKAGTWEAGCWFSNSSFKWGTKIYRGSSSNTSNSEYFDDRNWQSRHSGCSHRGTIKDNNKWVESNIPSVYLLSPEHAALWKDGNDNPPTPEAKSEKASDPIHEIIEREVKRLEADGWVEWKPEEEANSETIVVS
jgi:predicted glutamine amidotransferase